MVLKYIVDKNFFNLKDVLKSHFNISDRLLIKLKNNEKIFLNDVNCNINELVKLNDIITINLDFDEDNSNILPKQMNLNILYEDEGMLIINKPAFTPVHPSMLHYTDSLSNGVRFYFDSIGLKRKIRPVNICKVIFSISRLPDKEIGKSEFSAGTDYKVNIRAGVCIKSFADFFFGNLFFCKFALFNILWY